MASTFLPPPPVTQPLQDGSGGVVNAWAVWFAKVHDRLGGPTDKVEAAYQAAAAAAPAARQVVAVGGLHAGGDLTGNVALALYAQVTTVADLVSAGATDGDWAYALDGRKPGEAAGAGTGVPAWFSNGGWYACCSGALVAA